MGNLLVPDHIISQKNVNQWALKLEICVTIILLLCAESVSFPFVKSSFFNIITYGIILFLVSKKIKKFAYVLTRDISFLLFILFAIASFFWSASPEDTFSSIRAAIRSVLFGAYLAMQYTPKQLIRLLSWVTGIAVILSFVFCLVIPSYGIRADGTWQGIFTHKQIIGRFMSFTASIFLANILDRSFNRWIGIFGIFSIVTLIIMSQSKTGFISFSLSLILIPFYKIVKQKKARLLFMLIGLLILSIIAAIVALNIETIVIDYLGKNLEFNGRTPIWTLAIEEILKRPFIGYGYNGFWTSNFSNTIIMNTWAKNDPGFLSREVIFHAHNSFIDLLLEFGIIGSTLFIFSFILLSIRVTKLLITTRQLEYFWMFQFLGVYLVYSIAEGQAVLPTNGVLWIAYISIVFSSKIQLNRIKNR
jgi:exopolysaccharide production protein ExoQ